MIALTHIIINNREYWRGDVLPSDTGLDEIWESSGSACTEERYAEMLAVEPVRQKARRAAAKAGMIGKAVNSESHENLVGIVPKKKGRYMNGHGL